VAAGSAEGIGPVELALVAAARNCGVKDQAVLHALATTPRRRYLPADQKDLAHRDAPLSIGHHQTASQPSLVGWMTQLLQLRPESRVLEIGTGCGYQTAILASIAKQVYSIERLGELYRRTKPLLAEFPNVHLLHGDGFQGWPEEAPFDAILLTCAPPEIPEALERQLAEGGRLVGPVGGDRQQLKVGTCHRDQVRWVKDWPVRFVPMLPEVS
jgi:protein-L-isoaspartate(D-aspartate) O-methyltransferase